ncbi:MAG TPA: peptidylprolyl isomerase [Pseudomonadales bacterium]|nr:peptidylprolyl isomerase [Pseudomonadales bacterium]
MRSLFCLVAALLFSQLAIAVDNPRVRIDTTLGSFTLELYQEAAPITVANFLRYVDEGFYDNTLFHRIIKRFVVQGGGFGPNMAKKVTHPPIINESHNRLYNDRFTVAMARNDDPDSATSQFYINLRMNSSLDFRMGKIGYTVFGEVIEGKEVVHDMSYVETHHFAGMDDVPVEPVILIKAERLH